MKTSLDWYHWNGYHRDVGRKSPQGSTYLEGMMETQRQYCWQQPLLQAPFMDVWVSKQVKSNEDFISGVDYSCNKVWERRDPRRAVRNKWRQQSIVKIGLCINVATSQHAQALLLIAHGKGKISSLSSAKVGQWKAQTSPLFRMWEATLNGVGGVNPVMPASLNRE